MKKTTELSYSCEIRRPRPTARESALEKQGLAKLVYICLSLSLSWWLDVVKGWIVAASGSFWCRCLKVWRAKLGCASLMGEHGARPSLSWWLDVAEGCLLNCFWLLLVNAADLNHVTAVELEQRPTFLHEFGSKTSRCQQIWVQQILSTYGLFSPFSSLT